ncbi:hypothetical protein HPB47_022706 [Ixodes persulcatus]|uniref:Uncharacterized protein n=1 Tax=Ixodes persulcatus TaxID=34615 RepID=A0AC60Q9G8_IXOPE|nr:hypothetical protein HPB47_022706 [Ixodes persulcatus]
MCQRVTFWRTRYSSEGCPKPPKLFPKRARNRVRPCFWHFWFHLLVQAALALPCLAMDCAAVSARSEESVLRKHLRGLTKNGSTWTGYVESKESFEEFERDLAAAYVSFQTEHSIKLKGRLLFSSQRGHVVVNGDVPFKVVQSVEKGCLFGRDLKKVQDSRSSQVNLTEQSTKWERQTASKKAMTQLKLALEEEANGKDVLRQHRFCISMSDSESHSNHDIDASCAGYAQPVNQEVSHKICELVQQGSKSPEDNSRNQDQLQAGSPDCDVLESVARECDKTLLLCIQTEFMKGLMLKYSDDVVCLDATYKTTDYSLPLFLIVVKTASCYAVVGAFIVQFETAEFIEEALNIFKTWNPELSPKFWMVDYSQAEINALSAAFPSSRPVLCDFHREQAWQRWLSKKENEVGDVSAVKKMLRQVACSTNEDELKIGLESLKQSPQWRENEKLQAYVTQKWLSVKEMWVKMYRLDLPFGTNNGTESKNKELKSYLAGNSGRRSLQGLLRVLAEIFFPEKEAQFLRANMSFSPSYRLYHDYVPKFLHGRPPGVTKHIMERLTRASDYGVGDVKAGSEEGTFLIHSANESCGFHEVNFHTPSCTCFDFIKSKLPCRHFAAVFLLIDGWNFSRLPVAYRDGPHMTSHTVTSCTSFQVENSASPSEDPVEGVELGLQKASQQSRRHMKSQIRAQESVTPSLPFSTSKVLQIGDLDMMIDPERLLSRGMLFVAKGMATALP